MFQEEANYLGKMIVPVLRFRFPEGEDAHSRPHGYDLDIVVRDVLDLPELGTERKAFANGTLPHEFLVQLADLGTGVLKPHVEVAAFRDRTARSVEKVRDLAVRLDGVVHPVEGDARLQLPQAGVGIPAGKHFEHHVEELS